MAEPNWVDVATLCLGTIGGVAALWRYYEGQRWKQLEFVSDQIRQFETDLEAKNAMLMLDWNAREIDLYPDLENPKERFVEIDDAMLYRALAARQKLIKDNFEENEPEVRACFDAFFGYLQRFDQFIEAGLVSQRDFWPYLRYWVEMIGDRGRWGGEDEKQPILMRQIWDFLCVYGYTDVIRLFHRYGFEIALTREEEEELEMTLVLPPPIPGGAGNRERAR